MNQRGGVNNWTPLQHAIHKNQPAAVRALLEAHADVSDALDMAAGYGYADIVKMLLDAGAEPTASTISAAVGGSTDIDRPTIATCQTETVKTLLAAEPSLKSQIEPASLKLAKIAGCKDILAAISITK